MKYSFKSNMGPLSLLSCAGVLFFAFSSVQAEGSYIGIGAGLHFDLAGLNKTTGVDGVNSGVGIPSLQGFQLQTGCPDVQCQRELPGANQQIVVPNNKLIALEKSTLGIFNSKNTGSMTGLVLNVFYEREWTNIFLRGGVDYTKKIMGGYSSSEVAGIKWYEAKFDYASIIIPLYFGFRANIEKSSVYAGAGINYYEGGWSLQGTNMGDIPTYYLGIPVGLSTVVDASGKTKGGSIYKEHVKFRTKGYGFNALIGVDMLLESGNKTFFEIDYKIGGGQDSDRMRSTAGISAVAPYIVYPQNLSGVIFRFGYKFHTFN